MLWQKKDSCTTQYILYRTQIRSTLQLHVTHSLDLVVRQKKLLTIFYIFLGNVRKLFAKRLQFFNF